MKKIIAMALAVMLVLSMAACGTAQTGTPTGAQTNDGKYTIGIHELDRGV